LTPEKKEKGKVLGAADLREGEHYYIDPNGLFVFTEKYHLLRGTCCGSGCRHCPWKKK
jgi:hypothetical protein